MRPFLWVPGKFSLTNKMLDNLRAGSRYQGARPPRGWKNMFDAETAAIRLAVKAAARRKRIDLPQGDEVCMLGFYVFGHRKHDPDAWYLLGKAALDGLVDAGLFASDRFRVLCTGGRVLQSVAEEGRMAEVWGLADEEPGLVIEFAWMPGPTGRYRV